MAYSTHKPRKKHIMKNLKTYLVIVIVIAFVGAGIRDVVNREHKIRVQKIEIIDTSTKLRILDEKYIKLNSDLDHKTKTLEQVEQERQQLEKEKQELQRQLSAKKEAQRVAQVKTPQIIPTANASSGNCGDNPYKQFIYMKESGCRTDAMNSIGCYGIGQSCPASKIAHCGADFACQDAWFSNYAVTRYGSWEKAYNFWVKNRWW